MIRIKCQIQTSLQELDEEGYVWLHPQVVLAKHKLHLHQHKIQLLLVHWKDTPPEDATWEPTAILQ